MYTLWTLLLMGMAGSSQIIPACFPDTYITIGKLYESCQVPGECGLPLQCEGQTALIKGDIDFDNIFDQSQYPQLPYEKFLLVDGGRKILDVFAVSSDNASLFKRIFAARKEGKRTAFIKGIVRGFDAPVMGACNRGIRLEIHNSEDIDFR